MIDYANVCNVNVGPLACAVDEDRPDSDVETVSLYSAAMSRKTNATLDSLYDAPMDPIAALKKRVAIFQSKGWLSQQEHRKYMALLSTGPSTKENSSSITDPVIKELAKELSLLEEKMNGGTMLNKQTRLAVLTPKSTRSLQTPTAERPRAFGVFPQPKAIPAPLGGITNKSNNARPARSSIVEPTDISNDLSEDQLSELFVETCFFARLGFVQPPCCLQCTYRESMKGAIPNVKCGRWVIWRRDAKHVLHPHHLCDNAIAVQCHAARKLLAGKLVESHKWDKISKVLLQPRAVKPFQPQTCM